LKIREEKKKKKRKRKRKSAFWCGRQVLNNGSLSRGHAPGNP
jgi:hypothetical protein